MFSVNTSILTSREPRTYWGQVRQPVKVVVIAKGRDHRLVNNALSDTSLRTLHRVRIDIELRTHPVDAVLIRRERRLRASERRPEEINVILVVSLSRVRFIGRDFTRRGHCCFWGGGGREVEGERMPARMTSIYERAVNS